MEDKIEEYIIDAITGRPHGFLIGDVRLYIYPVTIGKMFITQARMNALGISEKILASNIVSNFIGLVHEKRSECISLVALYTCRDETEIFDRDFVLRREEFLDSNLSDDDVAGMMMLILSLDHTDELIKHFKIDKEQDAMRMVLRVKNDKNSINFGGKSQFGMLIDAACERYGWTKEYVVWRIDYTSLRLMMSDKINSIYLSDDELNKLPASIRSKDGEKIKPTKENMPTILAMDWH